MTPLHTKTLLIPRLLRVGALLGLMALAVGYASWQARHLIIGPEVTLMDEPAVEQSERVVWLKGVANNVTTLLLNGRPIRIDREGAFNVGVVLENGYTIISIDAKDRYGRTTHLERSFVYKGELELSLKYGMGYDRHREQGI